MKNLTMTTAITLALTSGTAFAGDDTDIGQLMVGVQKALNSISVTHNNTDIRQEATNAANLISWEGDDFDDLMQISWGTDQTAKNSASTVYGQWNDLAQSATNVLNSIDISDAGGVEASTAHQLMKDTDQVAENSAKYGQWVDGTRQDATNAANLFNGRDVNESVTQTFAWDSDQVATNSVYGANGDEYVRDLRSEATNVVNSISADDLERNVEPAMQFALGEQLASNYVDFGDGGLEDTRQTATNAANLITVDELRGTSLQVATLSQKARNTATFAGVDGQYTDGAVTSLRQTGTNAANILTASSLSSISGELEVAQFSSAGQLVQNSLNGQGALNNITQTATNVANSVSMPSVD